MCERTSVEVNTHPSVVYLDGHLQRVPFFNHERRQIPSREDKGISRRGAAFMARRSRSVSDDDDDDVPALRRTYVPGNQQRDGSQIDNDLLHESVCLLVCLYEKEMN